MCFCNSSWKAFMEKLGFNNFGILAKSMSTKNLLWNAELVNETVKLVLTIWCACSLKLKFWLVNFDCLVINYFDVCQFTAKANILEKNTCCYIDQDGIMPQNLHNNEQDWFSRTVLYVMWDEAQRLPSKCIYLKFYRCFCIW